MLGANDRECHTALSTLGSDVRFRSGMPTGASTTATAGVENVMLATENCGGSFTSESTTAISIVAVKVMCGDARQAAT